MISPWMLRRAGWLAFALMWIPFTGIFIGMIGMPEGSFDWNELPRLMRFSLISTFILFGFSMTGLMGALVVGGMSNRHLKRSGDLGEAVILEVWDTGTTINQSPVVGLRLEVHPPGGPVFLAETERLVSRLEVHQLQVGRRVSVRYDLENQTAAVLDE